ncbi:MAG: glycosyltransferase family 4 protein [Desulfobacteraceae bacterium]|nr:glycosyltransferase family 4 protein [Desulfobacteraceae bacterium]
MCQRNVEEMVAKPLTIVQMLPELITGGVERGTLETGAFFAENGHRSIVVSKGGPMVEALVKTGTEHITMPVGEKKPRALLCIPRLRQLFITQNVDILHLRSRVPAWVGLLASRSIPCTARPRIVTTFHGFYSVNPYSAVMTKGERVIAVSQLISDHIRDQYGVCGDHVRVIHRGFDATCFDPLLVDKHQVADLKVKWGIDTTKGPVLMLPGRFTELKGHKLFLSALEKIKHLSWTAVLVGDEREKPDYAAQLKKETKQKGLGDRVIFAGHCHNMAAAFMLCDVTISASIHPESFGRVGVESQAMGVPVVATAHGGSLETIIPGKTGWLFSPADIDGFARALAEAVSDEKKRKAMGHRARTWVAKHFTTALMCEKTLALYEELMATSQKSKM